MLIRMIKRWLAKWSKRVVDALSCFLRDPRSGRSRAPGWRSESYS